MTDFKGGGIPTPDLDKDNINFISEKTEFYDDVFVYGKLYADLGGDVQTFSTAGVERVRITKEGDIAIGSENPIRITKEGDVAIGSENPNVEVESSNTSILSVGIVTAREFYGTFKGSIDPAVANDKISEGNSEAEVVDTGSDGHFKVTTEGVERFRIQANGKVLIPSTNTDGNFVRDTVDTYQWNGTDTNANIPDSSIGLQIRNNDQTTHKTAALAEFRTYRNSSTANPGVVYIGAVDPGDGNAHRSDFIVALKSGNTTVNERLRIKYDGVINCGHGDEINLHGTTTTGINLNGNNNSGQIIANASDNRALIIGRQGSFGQVIEFFQGTNTNEASITIPAANTLAVTTNGDNERLRINSNGAAITGNLTVSAQPCVQLHTVSNIGNFGTAFNGVPLRFSGVHINQGGMTLSNNNSRVEVPVSGIYLVTAMASGGNYNTAGADDGVHFKLMRNGNNYPAENAYPFNTLGSANGMEFFWSFSILVDLTASDYLELQFDNISTNFGGSIVRGQFGVHLIS